MTREALDHQSTYTAQACGVLPVASPFQDRDTLVYEMFLGPDDTLQVSPLVDKNAANPREPPVVVVKSHVAAVQTVLKDLLDLEARLMRNANELTYGYVEWGSLNTAQAKVCLYEVVIVDLYKKIAPMNESIEGVMATAEFFGAVIGSVHYDHGGCMAFLVLQYFFPTKQFSLVLHVLVDKRTPCKQVITVEAYKEMMVVAEYWVRYKLGGIGIPTGSYTVSYYLGQNEIRFGPSTNDHLVLPILARYKPAKNVMPSSSWPANPRICFLCVSMPAVVVTDCKHQHQLMCIGCTEKLLVMKCPMCRDTIQEWWVAPPVLE